MLSPIRKLYKKSLKYSVNKEGLVTMRPSFQNIVSIKLCKLIAPMYLPYIYARG